MKCFVGCSSYDEIDEKYFESAREVSKVLIDKDYELVFGCCNRGLMGSVYDEFKSNNALVTAVCTEYYKSDLDMVDCNKVLVSTTMDQLNEFMKSDVMVFLPGGYGTYNEMFYMINAFVTKDHTSKIIVINTDGYYEELKSILSTIKSERFAKVFDFVYIVDTIDELRNVLSEQSLILN